MQLLFLITLFGFLFAKCKIVAWVEIVAMSLLYGGYNGTTDLPNYIWQYENEWMIDISLQKLYSFMSICFHNFGISFELYHVTITAISLMLICYISSKLTDQIAYVLSMISVFVYIENGWQLKTMMATCVIVVALYWFYKRIYNCKKNTIKKYINIIIFLVLIIVAAQFHFLSVFFVLFLFITFIKGHFIRVIMIDVCMFVFSGMLLFKVSSYIPMVSTYESPINLSVFIVTGLWQILGYFILFYSKDDVETRGGTYEFFVKDGTLVLMLLIPFYFYTNVATRIYKIWLIFMIIYATKLYRKQLILGQRRLLFDMYILGSSIFWYYIVPLMQGRESLIIDLMNNNCFF
ncbi:EpsG family protein [Selenomonas sp. ND2010]|uniref:EpsG family protein n=1 Tax=Selenomonas sp. ND2010 TaxID=1410618 RepID=UPI00051B7425|nr:EpsG family protein [Selenomonas sp. ND2010]